MTKTPDGKVHGVRKFTKREFPVEIVQHHSLDCLDSRIHVPLQTSRTAKFGRSTEVWRPSGMPIDWNGVTNGDFWLMKQVFSIVSIFHTEFLSPK
jgi:hypothetical protein